MTYGYSDSSASDHVIGRNRAFPLMTPPTCRISVPVDNIEDLKEKLNALRLYPNESYDSVIRRLTELARPAEFLTKTILSECYIKRMMTTELLLRKPEDTDVESYCRRYAAD